jgi:hypothetical protein
LRRFGSRMKDAHHQLGYVRTGLRENTNGLWTPPSRISDIEKSARRDKPRDFGVSPEDGRNASSETRVLASS